MLPGQNAVSHTEPRRAKPNARASHERLPLLPTLHGSLLGHPPPLLSPSLAPASARRACLRGPGGKPDQRPPSPDSRSRPELAPFTGRPAANSCPKQTQAVLGRLQLRCAFGRAHHLAAGIPVQITRISFSIPSQPKPTFADDPLMTGDSVTNI